MSPRWGFCEGVMSVFYKHSAPLGLRFLIYHVFFRTEKGSVKKKRTRQPRPYEDLKRFGQTTHAYHNRNFLKSRREELFIEEMDSRI